MTDRLKQIARYCRPQLITALCGGGFLLLFSLVRQNKSAADFIINYVTTPYKQAVSAVICLIPFSCAELLVLLAAAFIIFLIVSGIRRFRRDKAAALIKSALGICCTILLIYDGFCLFWGVNYYGSSFSEKSGLTAVSISTEELAETTEYYADLSNSFAAAVPRVNGRFAVTRDEIFSGSETLYDNISGQWGFLKSPYRMPKGVFCSRFMSYTGFTGVYFPFLGESNLNINSPTVMLPSTVAHELAHQKNIAPEQEANFVAVKASVMSGDVNYQYSGALLAYIHLSNALYRADYDKWSAISSSLCAEVLTDIRENNEYWNEFEKKPAAKAISNVSDKIYTDFLQGYGQELGMKSYGACVDLLAADYFAMKNKF